MTQGCDRSSPRRTSRKPEAIASVSLTKRTQFNRGAGKSLNIVFSRGLRAARTGGVVAAIPFACHTVRRRQRKNLLPNNPPLGFNLGTVTTTETLSTEATPEHHRGCFNAPRASPAVLDSDLPSPPTTIADPKHIRHPRPHTLSAPTTHPSPPAPILRHSRPSPNVIPSEVEESKPFMHNPHLPKRPPVRHLLPRPGTCYHTRHVPHTVVPGKSRNPSQRLSGENRNPLIRLSGAGRNPRVWVGCHTHVGLPERVESHTSTSSSPDTLAESQGGLATGAAPT